MKNNPYETYLLEITKALKEKAKAAKKIADHQNRKSLLDFYNGYLMTYVGVLMTLKNQAPFFDLTLNDIGLEDINPEHDLLYP